MKKAIPVICIIFSLFQKMQAQGGGVSGIIVALSQRSTVLYSDTIFEIDGLKLKITETYAFRNKVKTTLILLNQTENYKILHSEDFSIMDSDSAMIIVNAKKPIVIPPKTSKKIGLMAETKASFKLYDIKIGLKHIYTTNNPSVMKLALMNLHMEGMESMKNDILEIVRTKCTIAPDGSTRAFFKVAYSGQKFLGIQGSKAMLISANGKAYMNIAEKSKMTYYPEGKTAMTLLFEFDDHTPNFEGPNCDKVSFENVFVEYEILRNDKAYEFHTYKNGINEGDSPFDKKERENIED